MIFNINPTGFAGLITDLGAEVPKSLTDILDTIAAIKAIEFPPAVDIEAQARRGELTAKTAARLVTAAVNQPTLNPADVRQRAINGVTQRFGKAVQESVGDEVIEAIRPAFTAAADGIRAAATYVTPDTSAEQVLEMGPEAADAWRALPEHRAVLDRVHAVVSMLVEDYAIVEPQSPQDFGRPIAAVRAAFYVNDANVNLDSMAAQFDPEKNKGRGGRWSRMLRVSDLQLHTVTEVREIVATQAAESKKLRDAHYAATHS